MTGPGRPSTYTPELGEKICQLIASGTTLTKIVKMKGMPPMSTFQYWRQQYPELAKMYAAARIEQADVFADEIVDIADKTRDPKKARVQVDARKWHASKMHARKFGDSMRLEGGDNPLRTQHEHLHGKMGDAEATALYREMVQGRQPASGGGEPEDDDAQQ